jgi:hypothetical protein
MAFRVVRLGYIRGRFTSGFETNNLYNHALIDFDNIVFQIANRIEWCSSDIDFYPNNRTAIQNEVRSRLFIYIVSYDILILEVEHF